MQVILRVRAKCASVLVQVSLMDRSLERKYLSNINTNLFLKKNVRMSEQAIGLLQSTYYSWLPQMQSVALENDVWNVGA